MKPIITIETFKDPAFRKEVYEMLIKHYTKLIKKFDPNSAGTRCWMCIVIDDAYNVLPIGANGYNASLVTLLPELIRPDNDKTKDNSNCWYSSTKEDCQLRLENCKQALAKLIENGN